MEKGRALCSGGPWRRKVPSFIVISILVAGIFCSPALAAKKATGKTPSGTEGEVAAIVKKMADLYKKKDAKGLTALYSRDKGALAIGMGEDERLVGSQKIREGLERTFADFGEIKSVEIIPFATSYSGKTAWFAARMQTTALNGGAAMTFSARLTGVLMKQDKKWLFAQTHLSLPGDPGKAGLYALPPAVLGRIQKKLSTVLNLMDAELGDTASRLSKTGISGDEARKMIEGLCKKSAYAVDCAAIDGKGKMVIVEPQGYRKFEGADISGQEHMKRLHATGKPVFSPVFLSVEGFAAVDLEYPVFSQKNELLGSASILLNPETVFSKAVADEMKKAPSFEIWAMQTDGRVLYDRNRKRTGTVLFKDDLYKPYSEFLSLAERIAKEKEGHGFYRFSTGDTDKAVTQEAFWTTVALHGTEWRLVASRQAEPQGGTK
ncbi:MAG TPA: nuclear transport factor 2 family protein [Syntrophorhabdaceae bacterium]|jgi:ketosteroid isomerase-like protein